MLPGPESRHESGGRAKRERVSGWEVLDTGADVAGAVAGGVGWLVTKLYALLLIAAGIFVLVIADDFKGKAVGLAVAGYGAYVLFGGSWIVY